MNPLVAPGDYNVTYNQNYLLSHLHYISVYWSWLGIIIVSVLFVLFLLFIRRIWRLNRHTISNIKFGSNQQDAFRQFITIVTAYEDVKDLMPLSKEQLNHLYFKDMAEIIKILMPYEKYIYQNFHFDDVIKWNKYKELLILDANRDSNKAE